MKTDRTYLKHRIEVWANVLPHLHSCLGLDREGEKHPECKEALQALIEDIQDVMKSL